MAKWTYCPSVEFSRMKEISVNFISRVAVIFNIICFSRRCSDSVSLPHLPWLLWSCRAEWNTPNSHCEYYIHPFQCCILCVAWWHETHRSIMPSFCSLHNGCKACSWSFTAIAFFLLTDIEHNNNNITWAFSPSLNNAVIFLCQGQRNWQENGSMHWLYS